MERVRVSSSNLREVGYDPETHILQIKFKGGSLYQYSGVPPHIHDGLMNAGSHGKYFSAHIRDRYPTRKITFEGYS